MVGSVLVHVQHLLGIGHQRRAAAIAREFCRQAFQVCYVTGGEPVRGLDIATAELVQLPSARAVNARFDYLVDEHGKKVDDDWRRQRKQKLLDTFARVRPDVLLLETYPFGRKQFSFELEALLETACAAPRKPLIASSIRDILQQKGASRSRKIVEQIHQYFDLVLVHGDPRFVALSDSFELAGEIKDRIEYTGYVIERPLAAKKTLSRGTDVLFSTGGGYGGEQLLRAAVAARSLARDQSSEWRCMVGNNLPDSLLSELREAALPGLRLERNRSDFYELLSSAGVSVSQAGYNTVIEILDTGVPAVLIPFSEENETEQSVRAHLLERRGLASVVTPQDLNPHSLLAAIESAASSPRTQMSTPDTTGAASTVRIIKERLCRAKMHRR